MCYVLVLSPPLQVDVYVIEGFVLDFVFNKYFDMLI